MTLQMPAVFAVETSDQCEHAVEPLPSSVFYRTRSAADQGRNPLRCLKQIAYDVDGRRYCGVHAGAVLLGMAVREHRLTLSQRLHKAAERADDETRSLLAEAATALDRRGDA